LSKLGISQIVDAVSMAQKGEVMLVGVISEEVNKYESLEHTGACVGKSLLANGISKRLLAIPLWHWQLRP
jgi:hypothetical protein